MNEIWYFNSSFDFRRIRYSIYCCVCSKLSISPPVRTFIGSKKKSSNLFSKSS